MAKVRCDGCGSNAEGVGLGDGPHYGCGVLGTWRLVDEQAPTALTVTRLVEIPGLQRQPAKPPLTVQQAESLIEEQEGNSFGPDGRHRKQRQTCGKHHWFHDEEGCGKCHLEAAKAMEKVEMSVAGAATPVDPVADWLNASTSIAKAPMRAVPQRNPHPAEPRWPADALARAIFEERVHDAVKLACEWPEWACIADFKVDSPQDQKRRHVLDVMWAKTKPAERREAEAMATRLVARMGRK